MPDLNRIYELKNHPGFLIFLLKISFKFSTFLFFIHQKSWITTLDLPHLNQASLN